MHCLARLFVDSGACCVGEVTTESLLGCIHTNAVHAHWLDDFNGDWTYGCWSSNQCVTCEHAVLLVTKYNGEGSVNYATIWIETKRNCEVEVTGVAIEPEAVIGVWVSIHNVR